MLILTDVQHYVKSWMRKCFGNEIAGDKIERRQRFLEEALELHQAAGGSSEEAYRLVDYVQKRPIGEVNQEVGGVMLTLTALCNAHSISLETATLTELDRAWETIEKIRAKQANKPKFSPLPQ